MPSPSHFADLAPLLCCPDDETGLKFENGVMRCVLCSRRFHIEDEDFIEMLPSRPLELSEDTSYRRGYLDAFGESFCDDPDALAWGAAELVSSSWLLKRLRQVQGVESIVTAGTNKQQVLCDVAAGAGHYTTAYATQFRLVLHCDLSVSNLSYARRRARRLGIHNILFIRCDYFSLPFRQTIDRILCLDTLIRGEEHDSALLVSIGRALTPSGQAVVDFHNWWHNPLRRLGLLPDNFHHNTSYSHGEASRLLRSIGIDNFSYFPFVQEVDHNLMGRAAALLLPPTRLIYRFESPRVVSGQPVFHQVIERES